MWRRLTSPAYPLTGENAAVTNSYTLHGDAEFLLVTTYVAGLDFRD
jgi:hypothetical protein